MISLQQATRSLNPRHALIFIHGILSSHKTFTHAAEILTETLSGHGIESFYWDYNYREAMPENGGRLANILINTFSESDQVILIGHSMGGLIARFAALSQTLPFVKAIFLLGTPNGGAVTVGQLCLSLQLMHRGLELACGFFPRWAGVSGLTVAGKLIERTVNEKGYESTKHINYISIPALFFNNSRGVMDLDRSFSGLGFGIIDRIAIHTMAVKLQRPHDGIVEERSNHMGKCKDRYHEKFYSVSHAAPEHRKTYAHVRAPACNDLNHMQIQHDDEVIELLRVLITRQFAGATNISTLMKDIDSAVRRSPYVNY